MKQFNNYDEFKAAIEQIDDPEILRIQFYSKFIKTAIELRLDRGWTQEELAKKAGMQQSAIARFESFDFEPKLGTIYKIFDALGLEVKLAKKVQGDKKIISMPRKQYKPKRQPLTFDRIQFDLGCNLA